MIGITDPRRVCLGAKATAAVVIASALAACCSQWPYIFTCDCAVVNTKVLSFRPDLSAGRSESNVPKNEF